MAEGGENDRRGTEWVEREGGHEKTRGPHPELTDLLVIVIT